MNRLLERKQILGLLVQSRVSLRGLPTFHCNMKKRSDGHFARFLTFHPNMSRENTSRKEARKTCHLLQSRTWSTLEAQNFHSEDVEKVVRSQPAEQKFSEKKKIPCAKTYFYTRDFGCFPLQTLRQTPPTPNRSHGVFFFFFSFPLLFF